MRRLREFACPVPFLDLVHLKELRCAQCGSTLAAAGARSFVVDQAGDPVYFGESQALNAMRVALVCENGHTTELSVPEDVAAEATLMTPDEAPIGRDAALVETR